MIVCTAHVRVHFWVYKLNRVSGFPLDFLFTHHRQAALYRSCYQFLCAAPSRLIAAPDPGFGMGFISQSDLSMAQAVHTNEEAKNEIYRHLGDILFLQGIMSANQVEEVVKVVLSGKDN